MSTPVTEPDLSLESVSTGIHPVTKSVTLQMKSTKVKTLGTVALHATTACTDDASIIDLGPFSWAIV